MCSSGLGTIDPVKAQAVIDAGAELVRVGPTSDERKQHAEQIAADRSWTTIPPFDHDWIIAGPGTPTLGGPVEIRDGRPEERRVGETREERATAELSLFSPQAACPIWSGPRRGGQR